MAKRAPHLAGQLMFRGFGCRVVPFETVVTIFKVYVVLVEDSCPLKGCGCGIMFGQSRLRTSTPNQEKKKENMTALTMLLLASPTVAQLTGQRLLPTDPKSYTSTMALCLVLGLKVLARLVSAVGRAQLPLMLAGHFGPCLMVGWV